MSIAIGDKIVSDDYCSIGILTMINGKLFVVGDSCIEYDEYSADWEHYDIWLKRITK